MNPALSAGSSPPAWRKARLGLRRDFSTPHRQQIKQVQTNAHLRIYRTNYPRGLKRGTNEAAEVE
jgi:hypothetical protein